MTRSFKVKPTTVHERFGDEVVIVNFDSGNYYSALGTGTIIWSLVCDGASETSILHHVRAEFAGDDDEIFRDTAKFLDQLVTESLVETQQVVHGGSNGAGARAKHPDKVFSTPFLQKYTDMEEMLLLDPIHEVDEQGWPSARKSPD